MELLGGEMDFNVSGFVVDFEVEFTLVHANEKGLGGAGALRVKSSQFIFLRNYNKYTIYKDVIYKIKLNRNIPLLSWVLGLVSITRQMPKPRHKNKAIIRLSSHPSR